MTAPAQRFFVRQKITLTVNRYEVLAANPDGSEGALLGFAQQKRMAFKEQVTFYSDDSKSRAVFSFKARQGLDVRAEHDVLDEHGQPLAYFRKDFAASLLRSTWHLARPGHRRGWAGAAAGHRHPAPGVGLHPAQRRHLGAVRLPFRLHRQGHRRAVMTSERQKTVRDRYTIKVHDPRLDCRWRRRWPSRWMHCRAAEQQVVLARTVLGRRDRRGPQGSALGGPWHAAGVDYIELDPYDGAVRSSEGCPRNPWPP